LLAVLELHTYSSLNKEFLPEYSESLDPADHAIVMFDPRIVANKKMEPLDESDVRRSFGRGDIIDVHDSRDLEDALDFVMDDLAGQKFNILLMSSGSFGGLDLKKKLERAWDL